MEDDAQTHTIILKEKQKKKKENKHKVKGKGRGKGRKLIKKTNDQVNNELHAPQVPMKRRELPVAPWVDIAMDLLGPTFAK